MSTPSIPGVDRDALAQAIPRNTVLSDRAARRAADVALAYIAAHHECACDREHADEWVEVDEAIWSNLPRGARRRMDWADGFRGVVHHFIHRDDLARELGPAKADTFLGLLDEHGWTVTRKEER